MGIVGTVKSDVFLITDEIRPSINEFLYNIRKKSGGRRMICRTKFKCDNGYKELDYRGNKVKLMLNGLSAMWTSGHNWLYMEYLESDVIVMITSAERVLDVTELIVSKNSFWHSGSSKYTWGDNVSNMKSERFMNYHGVTKEQMYQANSLIRLHNICDFENALVEVALDIRGKIIRSVRLSSGKGTKTKAIISGYITKFKETRYSLGISNADELYFKNVAFKSEDMLAELCRAISVKRLDLSGVDLDTYMIADIWGVGLMELDLGKADLKNYDEGQLNALISGNCAKLERVIMTRELYEKMIMIKAGLGYLIRSGRVKVVFSV